MTSKNDIKIIIDLLLFYSIVVFAIYWFISNCNWELLEEISCEQGIFETNLVYWTIATIQ